MEYGPIFLIIIYTVFLLVLAKKGLTKTKDSFDFLIGGWSVPWFLATCIILGDWLGASVSIGVSQVAYESGISATSYVFGLGSGLIALALFFATPLRNFKCITIGEILEKLFNKNVRIISSILLAIAYFIISSAQLVGGGAIIKQLTNCSLNIGIIVTTVVTLIILLYGGVWSIGYTNVLNVVVLYFGLLIGSIYLIGSLGGIHNFLNSVPHSYLDISKIDFRNFFAVFLTGFLSAFVGQAGLMGVFSSKNPKTARKATFLAGILFIPIGLFCTIFGMGGRVIFKEGLPSSLQVLPAVISTFPTALKAIVFVSLWALMLSTTGPVIFALTQILVRDILPFASNKFDEIKDFILMKKILIIISVLCTIASFSILEVLQTTMFAYTVRNCLAISIVFGIILGRESWINDPKGIKYGILVGAITTISWVSILKRPFNIHEIYPTIFSYLLTVGLLNKSILISKNRDNLNN